MIYKEIYKCLCCGDLVHFESRFFHPGDFDDLCPKCYNKEFENKLKLVGVKNDIK